MTYRQEILLLSLLSKTVAGAFFFFFTVVPSTLFVTWNVMASFYVIRRSRIEFWKFLHWNITLLVQKTHSQPVEQLGVYS